MRFALVARRSTPTNDALAAVRLGDERWETMAPEEALEALRPGDVALGRLDVLPTLDGVDDGLWALGALAARGVTVLNEPAALLGAHDKLLTARLLRRSGIPHPRTLHVRPDRAFPAVRTPIVVKPRFGSWGVDVRRCDDDASLMLTLGELHDAPWFRHQGALVQELVPPQGYDLRILVAGERAVGAVFRVAAAGEWRTNISLGGARRPVSELPREACAIALPAAHASGATLVGVDLLPDGRGGWTVVEINGAVEFTHEYAPSGDIFVDVACELARVAVERSADVDSLATAAA
jgi:[lysine-biosynthesis-protein LysW]--L-2-aminoadipate ligase